MDTTGRRRPLVRGTIAAVVSLIVALAAAGVFVAATGDDDPVADADAVIRFTELDKDPKPLVEGDPTGDPVPEGTFATLGGGTASFADYRGKPLVVNFFASWCVPCRKEMPDIERVHRDLGDQVQVLGLALRDSERDATSVVDETGVTYDIARDPSGKLFSAFGGLNMPSTFLVSADGLVVEARPGALSEEDLRGLIADTFGIR
jgi:cytochrome c biogenesis protein CcmG/thiol:disulfide interchange protein DsbE